MKIHSDGDEIQVQGLTDDDRDWATTLLQTRWGSERIVTRSQVHEADQLPGFVAWRADGRTGLLTYRVDGSDCEVVSLDSLSEGTGVGTALIEAVKAQAIESGCTRLWLITTNDNTPAMKFYKRRGFALVAIHKGAIAEARELKPEIPDLGYGGTPIRDEVEFEIRLDDAPGS